MSRHVLSKRNIDPRNPAGRPGFQVRNSRSVTGVTGVSFIYWKDKKGYWRIWLRGYYGSGKNAKRKNFDISKLGLRLAWEKAIEFREEGIGVKYDQDFLEEAYIAFRLYYLMLVETEHRRYADL